MKRQFTHLRLVGIICMMVLMCSDVHAQWKLLKECKATYAIYVTKGGNILLSDFLFDYNGGIYLSQDKGETWTKTDVRDYNYSKFIEAGDYVFAIGSAGRVARSKDEGKTWELTNYTKALEGILDPSTLESTVCYAIAYHNEKLYIGDFYGGGVLYSEDFGETWKLTDRESLMYLIDDKDGKDDKMMESIYTLISFNGHLYACGVYFIFRYNETNNIWEVLRDDSNFMAIFTIFNGKLYCGRSVMNDNEQSPFLESTLDGNSWEIVKRPEGLSDNYVRTLASDAENIYVGMQMNGIYYTSNEGESWTKISEGLPIFHEQLPDYYLTPLELTSTDDYLYVAIYEDPYSERGVSGIYRMAKSDLPTSIKYFERNECNIHVDDSYLYINTDEKSLVSIVDVCGKSTNVTLQNGRVDIRNLCPGIYIYNVLLNDGKATGKFMKK